MFNDYFYLVLILICPINAKTFLHFEIGNEETVDITERIPTTNRYKLSTYGFPDELDIGLLVDGETVELQLTINEDVRTDRPIFLMRGDNLVQHKIPDDILTEQAVAYYHDQRNGSSFMAWHIADGGNKEAQYALFGTFFHGKKLYQIQPLDQDHVTSDISHVTHTLSLLPDDLPRPLDVIRQSNQDSDRFSGGAERMKRQAVTAYEIESFFVVDFAVYTFWNNLTDSTIANRANVVLNNINQFYAFVLNSINARFISVTGTFTMTCLYSGIYIADSSSAAPFIENNLLADDGSTRRKVDADVILPAFRDWANITLEPTMDYDHALLFTGYDMGTIANGEFNDAVAGYAYVGGVCGDNRYSINEDDFHASLATTAAHETGHILGSAHDGTGNTCDGNDGYVMAAVSSLSFTDLNKNRRQFTFSSCSIDYFSINLNTLGSPNCMESRSSNYNSSALAAYSDDHSGQLYPPDKQCQYIVGNGSYFYRRGYTSYEDICALMKCSFTNNNQSLWGKVAWEGTTCGNGKLCQAGSCVTNSSAPTGLNETCLFGDIPYDVPGETETCEEFLGPANKSYNCYQNIYQDLCCATCNEHKEANADRTDCEYGDKASWCATLSRSGCYNNDAVCCRSCAEQASSNSDCLYGDRSTSCDPNSCSTYTEATRNTTCCESCAETTTSTTTTPSSTTSTSTQATSASSQTTSTSTQETTSTQATAASSQTTSTSTQGTTSTQATAASSQTTSTSTQETTSSQTTTPAQTSSSSTSSTTTATNSTNNDNGCSRLQVELYTFSLPIFFTILLIFNA